MKRMPNKLENDLIEKSLEALHGAQKHVAPAEFESLLKEAYKKDADGYENFSLSD